MLDPQGRREVMSVVRELNRKYGITVILITHHMDEAVQAQRVVVMHEGNVLMDGRPREIFTQVGQSCAPPRSPYRRRSRFCMTSTDRTARACRSTR